jgi:uncharacterized protein GlcG (DUF336 family)
MADLTIKKAMKIITEAQKKARAMNLDAMTYVVLDAGGHLKALVREDGTGNIGPDVGIGKANACLSLRRSSREVATMLSGNPSLAPALGAAIQGRFLPIPGGVLIVDRNNTVLGAAGCTGASADNDETAIIAGVEAAGFKAKLG